MFKESFEAGVESKEEMSKVEKFVYLRSLLRGKAEQLVNGLSLTGENYVTALKLLDERYGDKQGLINEHTSKLIKLPKVKDISIQSPLENSMTISNVILEILMF